MQMIMSSFCTVAVECDRSRFIIKPEKPQVTAKQVSLSNPKAKILVTEAIGVHGTRRGRVMVNIMIIYITDWKTCH